jgi:uncharacterized repeat protein (TIGR03843 family)
VAEEVAEEVADDVADLPGQALDRVLRTGELDLRGRILPASNATFFADSVGVHDGREVRVPCVYKPVAGERPLWDFPEGTLAARERAAYVVSEALGWRVVPLTILREGPHGHGMVQVWCEVDEAADPVDLYPAGEVPDGFLDVFDATDGEGHDVTLVHEDSEPLRRMAVFDVLVNNADRKGGHVLPMPDGHRYGVDHGVCFHVDHKLRTVLWGWAGRRLHREDRATVATLARRLDEDAALCAALAELLAPAEVAALKRRCTGLVRAGRMPDPSRSWPAIPWPAF